MKKIIRDKKKKPLWEFILIPVTSHSESLIALYLFIYFYNNWGRKFGQKIIIMNTKSKMGVLFLHICQILVINILKRIQVSLSK